MKLRFASPSAACLRLYVIVDRRHFPVRDNPLCRRYVAYLSSLALKAAEGLSYRTDFCIVLLNTGQRNLNMCSYCLFRWQPHLISIALATTRKPCERWCAGMNLSSNNSASDMRFSWLILFQRPRMDVSSLHTLSLMDWGDIPLMGYVPLFAECASSALLVAVIF